MIFPEIKEIDVSVGDTVQFYPSNDNYIISYLPSYDKSIQIHGAPNNQYDRTGVRLPAYIKEGAYCNLGVIPHHELILVLRDISFIMSGAKGPFRLLPLKKDIK